MTMDFFSFSSFFFSVPCFFFLGMGRGVDSSPLPLFDWSAWSAWLVAHRLFFAGGEGKEEGAEDVFACFFTKGREERKEERSLWVGRCW